MKGTVKQPSSEDRVMYVFQIKGKHLSRASTEDITRRQIILGISSDEWLRSPHHVYVPVSAL